MRLVLFAAFISFGMTDIIDYTREDYVLIEDGDVLLYEDYGDIFHIANITYFASLLEEMKQQMYNRNEYIHVNGSKTMHTDFDVNEIEYELEIELMETLIKQLQEKDHRFTRGINELGTLWKWIAGTPDHDDLVLITNKLNELVENSNKQYTTNSQMFKAITHLTERVKELQGNAHIRMMSKRRNSYIINELQNLIQTITLAKVGILNPAILHIDEIRNITRHEHGRITITDLIDDSQFKVIQNKELIVIYIKYPKVLYDCKFYEVRAIAQRDGKLIIEDKIAKCGNDYVNVKECKEEIKNTYCKIEERKSCLSKILNKARTKCKKLKEKNKEIEEIKQGAILVSGTHVIDERTLDGVYLIVFKNYTIIDNVTYENIDEKIWNYVKTNYINNFEITEYVESTNEYLKFENSNVLNKIKQEIQEKPIWWSLTTVLIVSLSFYTVYKLIKKIYVKKALRSKNIKEMLIY